MYEPFEAITSDFTNKSMEVICINTREGPCMCIRYKPNEVVAITKAQAMKFFGLVEPEFTDGVLNPK
jgi:hypothetical protein